MKKYIAIALMAVSCLATAKGSSASASESSGSVMSFADVPRVMIFEGSRNAIGLDGQLLVCLPEFKSTVVSNEYACVDANGRNAWSVAENALRGYKLQAYEYRFVGAGGNRNLILYFGK
jgi:hypothetical protein